MISNVAICYSMKQNEVSFLADTPDAKDAGKKEMKQDKAFHPYTGLTGGCSMQRIAFHCYSMPLLSTPAAAQPTPTPNGAMFV